MPIDKNIKAKIVLALDVKTLDEAKKLVDTLFPYVGVFKIGLQLYCAYGSEIIDYIKMKNSEFFLDVKLMDIPNTVEGASERIVSRGATFFNVHTLGGLEMMKAAVRGAEKALTNLCKTAMENSVKKPVILGVTMLTSISDEVLKNELQIEKNVSEYAIHLAKLAKEAGLDGVVASPQEVERIKSACGKDFKVLCPGIRPLWAVKNDQKRIATPENTLRKGADYIVLGRAVTAAENPLGAIERIYEEII